MDQKTRKIFDVIANIGMGIFGLLAMLLVSFGNPWGFVVGLCSQPFFFMCSILHRQWGLFVLNVAYTITWIIGVCRLF